MYIHVSHFLMFLKLDILKYIVTSEMFNTLGLTPKLLKPYSDREGGGGGV